MRKKSITLKNGVHPAFVRGHIIDDFAFKDHFPTVRLHKAGNTAQRCGLAAAGGSQQRYKLFFIYIQIQFV